MNAYELENKHEGETCLIIGNGPSLNDIPVSFLRSYPSFGTNRIYLLSDFVPTYYACVNPLVLEQYLPDIINMRSDAKFISSRFASLVPGAFSLRSTPIPAFSSQPLKRIYEGYTVTFVCMQLAYWMGFERVLLVGVDHSYKFDGVPNEERTMNEVDQNHFAGEYFQGAKWNNPDLARSEAAYKAARTVYKTHGRQIINCSTKTALDVFARDDWRNYEEP